MNDESLTHELAKVVCQARSLEELVALCQTMDSLVPRLYEQLEVLERIEVVNGKDR